MIRQAALGAALALSPLHSPAEHKAPVTQAAESLKAYGQTKFKNYTLSSPEEHKTKVLQAISNLESSGGQNIKHRLITQGAYKGNSAYGSYGLLPVAVQEVKRKHPELLSDFNGHSTKDVAAYFGKHPHKEKEVASKYYDIIKHGIGTSEPSAISHAWLNGSTGYHKAKKAGVDFNKHWRGVKINKEMEKLNNK